MPSRWRRDPAELAEPGVAVTETSGGCCGLQDGTETRPAQLRGSYEKRCDYMAIRIAYRCRAYPDTEQQAMLNRTFGCVRVVWNRTLAARHARWQLDRTGTRYPETD